MHEAIDEGLLDLSILDNTNFKREEKDAGKYYERNVNNISRNLMNTQMYKAKILGFDAAAQKQVPQKQRSSSEALEAGKGSGLACKADSVMENVRRKNRVSPP